MRLVPNSAFSLSALLFITPVALFASAMTVVVVGCSANETSVFSQPPGDSAPPVDTTEAGSLFHDDGGVGEASTVDSSVACTPSLAAGFTPTWKPPATAVGKCNATQIDGYFDACMKTPIDPKICTTFMQANKPCATCLESDASASKYGPIIWHANRSFFTFNVAGCIAIEQKDTSDTGCGAAYQASVSCKEASCEDCFTVSLNIDKYHACETQAGTSACQPYGVSVTAGCPNLQDAGATTSACFLTSSESNKNLRPLFARVAPLFCGG